MGLIGQMYLMLLAGLSLAHLADNLLNDLSDYRKGIDGPGYFGALHGPHPVIDGLLLYTIKLFIAVALPFNAMLAVALSLYSTPLVGLLAVAGVYGPHAGTV